MKMISPVLFVVTLAVQQANAEPSSATKPGLAWLQYHSSNFQRPHAVGVDKTINIDTADQVNDYSRLWRGSISLPLDIEVTLSAEADDGVRIYSEDKLILDGWGKGEARVCKLTAKRRQQVPLEIRYYQQEGMGHIRLYWAWEGRGKEIIPEKAFSHTQDDWEGVKKLMGKNPPDIVDAEIKSIIYGEDTPKWGKSSRLTKGPHIFVDDYLIAKSTNIEREILSPRRDLDGPVVTGGRGDGDDCFQPYMEIIRDLNTGRFRIWYGVPENAGQSHLAHMESEDGIHWIRPHKVLDDPDVIQFGVSIIDEGSEAKEPSRRYRLGYFGKRDAGLSIAVSPDGLNWKALPENPVLEHSHDINNIYWDPIRGRYMAIVSVYIKGPTWSGQRRVTMASYSDDLIEWLEPWLVITPDDAIEDGETQFYAMCGFLARGDLLIGMVKVLHDDYFADETHEAYGIGYTALAWTRDGVHWERDRTAFFDRHPERGQWDHAMSWVDCQVPVEDEVYLYYGGYEKGHKSDRFTERQIGLVRIRRDRYVARTAGDKEGTLRTPPVLLDGTKLYINANAAQGELRVQLTRDGKAIDGFSFSDCNAVTTDGVKIPLRWKGNPTELKGQQIVAEFKLRNTQLFALYVE